MTLERRVCRAYFRVEVSRQWSIVLLYEGLGVCRHTSCSIVVGCLVSFDCHTICFSCPFLAGFALLPFFSLFSYSLYLDLLHLSRGSFENGISTSTR